MKETITRKRFFKIAGSLLFSTVIIIWYKMVDPVEKLNAHKVISEPLNPNKQFSFYKDFIVVNKNGDISVFSSHCSHLGCIINRSENDTLVCPCHGSVFNESGNPMRGPAIKPLKQLDFRVENQRIIVTL